MLGPEPLVLDGRQALLDAQALYSGAAVPRGFYQVSWYGTVASDERGCFAVVDPACRLADCVGEILEVRYYPLVLASHALHTVRVYVIGSLQNLGTDLGVTRRSYMVLERLSTEPITASIGIVG